MTGINPIFRCSSLDILMTEPQSAKAKASGDLSKSAISHIRKVAKEFVYGYRNNVSTKYMKKGIICEQNSIDLFNLVTGMRMEKNESRITSGLLTGECDLVCVADRHGYDIKTAWSLDTFPAFADEIDSKGYEWQARGYMHLWDCDDWGIAYAMVSTPPELCAYEDQDMHYVDFIDPAMRLTVHEYHRDEQKEKDMLCRLEKCKETLLQMVEDLNKKQFMWGAK